MREKWLLIALDKKYTEEIWGAVQAFWVYSGGNFTIFLGVLSLPLKTFVYNLFLVRVVVQMVLDPVSCKNTLYRFCPAKWQIFKVVGDSLPYLS